ncbi:hypothetical protein FY036_00740 [Mesorhizobium microcysteis]|uniref:Uncharacterized protein n=1 Tax=Neoaquamicrobium microcysteis TaxID=2682781 RepID=A0A5D4HA83_9HYPH|nr:hypothetical protein FY036_00740 [Mesorhizobium microcysteis]
MDIIDVHTRSIADIADAYARTRQQRSRPLSIRTAIRALRILAPENPCSDKELSGIVAAAAVRYGHPVEFDA